MNQGQHQNLSNFQPSGKIKLPEHHVDQSLQPSSKVPGPSQSAQAERKCVQVPAWTRKIK